ncbi:MAG: hypothetical protein Q4G11_00005 [Gallicola sp.]|nr:hypothetical protein [Gallicola sp.]
MDKLKVHVKQYDKKLPKSYNKNEILIAKERAEKLSRGKDLVRTNDTGTEMYKLIEILISKEI